MLRVNSEKTYRLIKIMLEKKKFSQIELAEKLKISPARVNEVVKWLVKKDYAHKYEGLYEVSNPLGIVNLFSYLRDMSDLKITTIKLGIEKNELLKYLEKEKVVFCGTTALQFYSDYFRNPSVNFYANNYEKIKKEMEALPRGLLVVNIYRPDMFLEEDTVKKKGVLLTSEIRTIIDLFCGNFAYGAKILIERLWGVKIG